FRPEAKEWRNPMQAKDGPFMKSGLPSAESSLGNIFRKSKSGDGSRWIKWGDCTSLKRTESECWRSFTEKKSLSCFPRKDKSGSARFSSESRAFHIPARALKRGSFPPGAKDEGPGGKTGKRQHGRAPNRQEASIPPPT